MFFEFKCQIPAQYVSEEAILWYKILNPHQRITLKEECETILGLTFELLSICFSLLEIIGMCYRKLQGEPL